MFHYNYIGSRCWGWASYNLHGNRNRELDDVVYKQTGSVQESKSMTGGTRCARTKHFLCVQICIGCDSENQSKWMRYVFTEGKTSQNHIAVKVKITLSPVVILHLFYQRSHFSSLFPSLFECSWSTPYVKENTVRRFSYIELYYGASVGYLLYPITLCCFIYHKILPIICLINELKTPQNIKHAAQLPGSAITKNHFVTVYI